MRASVRIAIPALVLMHLGCQGAGRPEDSSKFGSEDIERVDRLVERVSANADGFRAVATIDHARLAKAAGVEMPPSVVVIFSEPSVDSALMQANPRVGLDLPHRVLAYAEPGGDRVRVAFADATYLGKRHGITDRSLLDRYQETMERALEGISADIRSPIDAGSVSARYGLIELASDYPFDQTAERLERAVRSQPDTVWFGEVDFRQEAASTGIEIPPAKLLLFGGPGPGGRAMGHAPRLGLDAFCQKLLVYENRSGQVRVAFNDIVALAELHYGTSNKVQKLINTRLRETFSRVIRQ